MLPFDDAVQLDEEDSLGLDAAAGQSGDIEVAVLRLPGLSNFTDFAALRGPRRQRPLRQRAGSARIAPTC